MLDIESVDYSVQDKRFKIYFQDGGYLGFPIRMILTIFYLRVILMLTTKFLVDCLSVQEKKLKIDFRLAAMAAILDFPSKTFQLSFIYKLPQYFLPSSI